MKNTKFDSVCTEAEKKVVKNMNAFAAKHDPNMIVGNTVFTSHNKTCVKEENFTLLFLVLHAQEDEPLSMVGAVCAKVDQTMNIISWSPYC